LGSSLSITSAGVTGGSGGINAANFGVGPLTIVTNGDVEGASATGIYASNTGTDLSITSQDVAGGTNGIVAQNQGIGALTIIANGDVVGSTGAGIYTNVVGTGPATVTVSSGATVAGGSAGVQFGDSTITSNALNNFGNVSNPAGLAGTAIFGGASNETVNNFGVVTGNVLLGGGTNAFHNMDGGLFNSGTTVNLGAGNLLTNDGTLSPGGAFSPAGFVTTLTGDFVQPGSELDINLLGAAADRLDVTGDAELAGQVKPLFTLSGLGSATQWTVLTTESSPIQDNGIQAVDTHGCPDQVRA
jgi:hypothetical protein